MGQPADPSASAVVSSLFSAPLCSSFPKTGSDRWDEVIQQVPGASNEGKASDFSGASSHP